ncbi:hypothetical protein HK102_012000 [Quaeritorhiza haematococci]|nr:hypothetical protein HK102_012000 [Quaeritorhiza haematococci]
MSDDGGHIFAEFYDTKRYADAVLRIPTNASTTSAIPTTTDVRVHRIILARHSGFFERFFLSARPIDFASESLELGRKRDPLSPFNLPVLSFDIHAAGIDDARVFDTVLAWMYLGVLPEAFDSMTAHPDDHADVWDLRKLATYLEIPFLVDQATKVLEEDLIAFAKTNHSTRDPFTVWTDVLVNVAIRRLGFSSVHMILGECSKCLSGVNIPADAFLNGQKRYGVQRRIGMAAHAQQVVYMALDFLGHLHMEEDRRYLMDAVGIDADAFEVENITAAAPEHSPETTNVIKSSHQQRERQPHTQPPQLPQSHPSLIIDNIPLLPLLSIETSTETSETKPSVDDVKVDSKIEMFETPSVVDFFQAPQRVLPRDSTTTSFLDATGGTNVRVHAADAKGDSRKDFGLPQSQAVRPVNVLQPPLMRVQSKIGLPQPTTVTSLIGDLNAQSHIDMFDPRVPTIPIPYQEQHHALQTSIANVSVTFTPDVDGDSESSGRPSSEWTPKVQPANQFPTDSGSRTPLASSNSQGQSNGFLSRLVHHFWRFTKPGKPAREGDVESVVKPGKDLEVGTGKNRKQRGRSRVMTAPQDYTFTGTTPKPKQQRDAPTFRGDCDAKSMLVRSGSPNGSFVIQLDDDYCDDAILSAAFTQHFPTTGPSKAAPIFDNGNVHSNAVSTSILQRRWISSLSRAPASHRAKTSQMNDHGRNFPNAIPVPRRQHILSTTTYGRNPDAPAHMINTESNPYALPQRESVVSMMDYPSSPGKTHTGDHASLTNHRHEGASGCAARSATAQYSAGDAFSALNLSSSPVVGLGIGGIFQTRDHYQSYAADNLHDRSFAIGASFTLPPEYEGEELTDFSVRTNLGNNNQARDLTASKDSHSILQFLFDEQQGTSTPKFNNESNLEVGANSENHEVCSNTHDALLCPRTDDSHDVSFSKAKKEEEDEEENGNGVKGRDYTEDIDLSQRWESRANMSTYDLSTDEVLDFVRNKLHIWATKPNDTK